MALRRHTGIIVSRPALRKALYEYGVIPDPGLEQDVLATSIPPELHDELLLAINTSGVVLYLKKLAKVNFVWRIERRGIRLMGVQEFPVADIIPSEGIVSVEIDTGNIDQTINELRKHIDEKASFFSYEEAPKEGPEFLRSLAHGTTAGTKYPKRFLATAVAFNININNETKHILVPLTESYLWVQSNLEVLSGQILLPKYSYVIIVGPTLDKQTFRDEIVSRIQQSISLFSDHYSIMNVEAEEEE